MKKFIPLLGILLLAGSMLNAQVLTDTGPLPANNIVPSYAEGINVNLIETDDPAHFLTLDTSTGEIWHIQLSDREADTFKTLLSPADESKNAGLLSRRFVLLRTSYEKSYLLFDKREGKLKFVTWNPDPARDKVVEIKESPFMQRRNVGTL